MAPSKIRVGIVGGTGYTGVELLRWLSVHPYVELGLISSRSHAGTPVVDMFPSLRGFVDLAFAEPTTAALAEMDVVFFATPHATAMHQVPELLDAGCRVIDLGADFRLRDPAIWKQWYDVEHACPQWLEQAAYGLPEWFEKDIRDARLVANPGCYPTAVSLALLPLLKADVIEATSIVADCKSGVSGAGRKASVASAFSEVSDSFKAYAVKGHRHLPEIRQVLRSQQSSADLVFIPHLVPMIRGMQATIYVDLKRNEDIQALLEKSYADHYFVDVLPPGKVPDTRSVRAVNFCRLSAQQIPGTQKLVLISVIDNLVKGASGQAVQNMNLMFGLDESTGLQQAAVLP